MRRWKGVLGYKSINNKHAVRHINDTHSEELNIVLVQPNEIQLSALFSGRCEISLRAEELLFASET